MNIIDGTEFGQLGTQFLARRAIALQSGDSLNPFPGKRIGLVFFNNSLRTRVSMGAAAEALQIQPVTLSPGTDAWSLEFTEGAIMNGEAVEHVKDAAAVLSGYVDILAVRSFAGLTDLEEDRSDPVVRAFAEYASVPVINMESCLWHPLQGLADTATWVRHLGHKLTGKKLTLTWAPHPKALPAAVANQVLLSSALMGMDVTVAHPDGFDLDPDIIDRADIVAQTSGGGIRVTTDREAGFRDAEVVVAKSWSGFSGYGRREEEALARHALGHWCVDNAAMSLTNDAGFMHCLPVRRNVVVKDEVIDGARSWVHEEAHLRMWSAMALLEELCAGGAS
jgi:N-acetylornithine carbamoyltransferase